MLGHEGLGVALMVHFTMEGASHRQHLPGTIVSSSPFVSPSKEAILRFAGNCCRKLTECRTGSVDAFVSES